MEHVITVLTVIILTGKINAREIERSGKRIRLLYEAWLRSLYEAWGPTLQPRTAARLSWPAEGSPSQRCMGWSETVAHYSVHSVMAGSRRKSLGSLETRWPARKRLFHRAEALIYPCQGGKRIIKRKLAAVTVRSQNENAVEVND